MKHSWELDEDGDIDDFAYDDDWNFHNGPRCLRCSESFCIHCEPERWLSIEEEDDCQ